MALTQMQLIQSLGEAMAWFEREINWGVPATELRHLCGRIGELYVALITNGQMATEVNQKGYDVVSEAGERISVKTTAMMDGPGHITFNANTLDLVDRVIVLRVNTEEMQVEILLDKPIFDAISLMQPGEGDHRYIPLSHLIRKPTDRRDIKAVKEVNFHGYVIQEKETGSIVVMKDGVPQDPVKPVLRELAGDLNVGLLNSSGNPLNTRQLASQIIKSVVEMSASQPQQAASSDHPTTVKRKKRDG
jgi:hypothetical protein